MSFADDLRNAKTLQEKEEEMQTERDWNKLIDLLYNWLKEECQATAKHGFNYIGERISCFFERHRNEYASDEESEWMWDTYEDEAWWKRIYPRISDIQYPYRSDARRTICFSEKDSKDISAQLASRLRADGLNVQINERKFEMYRREYEHVEYKGAEKTLAGIFSILDSRISEDGYRKAKDVIDHYRCELSIEISW